MNFIVTSTKLEETQFYQMVPHVYKSGVDELSK